MYSNVAEDNMELKTTSIEIRKEYFQNYENEYKAWKKKFIICHIVLASCFLLFGLMSQYGLDEISIFLFLISRVIFLVAPVMFAIHKPTSPYKHNKTIVNIFLYYLFFLGNTFISLGISSIVCNIINNFL